MKQTLLTALLLAPLALHAAELKLASAFTDHAVLQRDVAVPVWGQADAGEDVTVEFAGQKKTAKADASGKWQVKLDPLPASAEPRTLTVRARNTVTVSDVLVGEVWLASGQSNMQMGVKGTFNDVETIKNADDPLLRGFICAVEQAPAEQAFLKTPTKWELAAPTNVGGWSAVTYFMARKLRAELKVPVGIMMASCGATPAQIWTAPEGVEFAPKLAGEKNVNHAMYHAMIHPLVPYALRGAIWYQGENNLHQAGETAIYGDRFKALVGGWRKVWGQGDFPVYAVEVAPCPSWYSNTQLAQWCNALSKAVRETKNTGLVVSNDLTDSQQLLHPVQKREVGDRLALLALGNLHGVKMAACASPEYASATVDGATLKLKLTQSGDGIKSKDGQPLFGFEITGGEFDEKVKDYIYLPAQATAKGDTVILTNDKIAKPVAARYAWAYSEKNNVVNSVGLPVNTFLSKNPPLVVKVLRGWTAKDNANQPNANNAIDGVGSIWTSWICKPFGGGTKDAPLDAWLAVNFGKDKLTLKGVKIASLGAGEAHVLVQIPDGKNWKTIGEYKGKGDTSPVIPFAEPLAIEEIRFLTPAAVAAAAPGGVVRHTQIIGILPDGKEITNFTGKSEIKEQD